MCRLWHSTAIRPRGLVILATRYRLRTIRCEHSAANIPSVTLLILPAGTASSHFPESDQRILEPLTAPLPAAIR